MVCLWNKQIGQGVSRALHPCVTFAASKVTKTARDPLNEGAKSRTLCAPFI